jgi:hypothetical protein
MANSGRLFPDFCAISLQCLFYAISKSACREHRFTHNNYLIERGERGFSTLLMVSGTFTVRSRLWQILELNLCNGLHKKLFCNSRFHGTVLPQSARTGCYEFVATCGNCKNRLPKARKAMRWEVGATNRQQTGRQLSPISLN